MPIPLPPRDGEFVPTLAVEVRGKVPAGAALLRQIAEWQLPCTLYAPDDIDKLRALRSAGLIAAFISPAEQMQGGGRSHKPAQILAITAQGWRALIDSPPHHPDRPRRSEACSPR